MVDLFSVLHTNKARLISVCVILSHQGKTFFVSPYRQIYRQSSWKVQNTQKIVIYVLPNLHRKHLRSSELRMQTMSQIH